LPQGNTGRERRQNTTQESELIMQNNNLKYPFYYPEVSFTITIEKPESNLKPKSLGQKRNKKTQVKQPDEIDNKAYVGDEGQILYDYRRYLLPPKYQATISFACYLD
jgi:hypothetical protein